VVGKSLTIIFIVGKNKFGFEMFNWYKTYKVGEIYFYLFNTID